MCRRQDGVWSGRHRSVRLGSQLVRLASGSHGSGWLRRHQVPDRISDEDDTQASGDPLRDLLDHWIPGGRLISHLPPSRELFKQFHLFVRSLQHTFSSGSTVARFHRPVWSVPSRGDHTHDDLDRLRTVHHESLIPELFEPSSLVFYTLGSNGNHQCEVGEVTKSLQTCHDHHTLLSGRLGVLLHRRNLSSDGKILRINDVEVRLHPQLAVRCHEFWCELHHLRVDEQGLSARPPEDTVQLERKLSKLEAAAPSETPHRESTAEFAVDKQS